MHTSQTLRSSHFEYRRTGAGGRVAFSSFCADYHEQDRVGVVSPHLEDGVLHTGYALLALTTAFYDVQRAGGSDFFIYPQHFAIIGQGPPTASPTRAETGRADQVGIATGAGCLDLTLDEAGIGGAWAWLDVWPASNWLTAPQRPPPCSRRSSTFTSTACSGRRTSRPNARKRGKRKAGRQQSVRLPDYARRILRTRLKSVYYYNTSAPTVEICADRPAVEIVQASLARLPAAVQRTLAQDAHPERPQGHESYRQVGVDDFLEDMEACFTA